MTSNLKPPHVIIVGGGFGGLYAARGLADAHVQVTILDKHNYHLFRPMLYQVATGLLSADEIAAPIRSIFRRQAPNRLFEFLIKPIPVDLPRGELRQRLVSRLTRFEVAGPGFLNLFLADAWYRDALRGVLDAGDDYGGGFARPSERVLVEFVSANPTGPMHVGHARNAAYGDARPFEALI